MADAIAESLESGRHLLVQAGTGTGKSLGYLAPALVRLAEGSADRIIVATATLALQTQLADNDIPAALTAVEKVTKKRPRHAVLKGRTNYACLYRARSGGADDQAALFGVDDLASTLPSAGSAEPDSALGAEVLRLREWIEEEHDRTGVADRDSAPSHSEKGSWQQVSIPGPGMPRRAALPVRRLMLRRAVPGRTPGRPTSWSPTMRCWRSTRCTARPYCPSMTG